MLVLLTIYTIICEWRGDLVSRWNSNAWSSQLRWNRGQHSLEFQLVLYQLFHASQWSKLNHLSLLLDGMAWLSWLRQTCGFEYWAGFLTLQFFFQTTSYLNRSSAAIFLTISYVILSYLSYLSYFPAPLTVDWIPYALVLLPGVRAVGHAIWEPAPPLMFGNDSLEWTQTPSGLVYVQYARKHCWSAVWTPFIGWLSELQAGLPFRLLPITILSLFSFDPFKSYLFPKSINWEHIQRTSNEILQHGWTAWHVTNQLYSKRSATK